MGANPTSSLLAVTLIVIACGCAKQEAAPAPVRVDLHMMSRCPFGGQLLANLAKTEEKLGERLDVRVHYIGKEEDGGFRTLYGPRDVDGDKYQLCANQVADTRSWLSFMQCQQQEPELIPDNWPDCAKQAGIDAAALSACATGDVANRLLSSSLALSNKKGVKDSPTLFIDDRKHEGGRMQYHLERALCDAMAAPKHDYCNDLPEPPELNIVVLTHRECEGKGCDTSRFKQFVDQRLPGAKLKEIEYSSREGKALFAAVGGTHLPLAVLDAEVEKREDTFRALASHVRKVDSRGYVYQVGKSFEPPQ